MKKLLLSIVTVLTICSHNLWAASQMSVPETVTAAGALSAQVPAGHALLRVLIRNTSANAITGAKLGLEATGNDLMGEQDIAATPARHDFIPGEEFGQLLHETVATTLYFSATNLNSATVVITIFTKGVAVPK